jgi:hypothetical protein
MTGANVYGRRGHRRPKLLTKDEARRIATATNRSAKAKAAELRSAAKA